MKKGISLIVLVITIIVMIVIAGAIILSLNSSNVTAKANEATLSSDRGNLQAAYATALAGKINEDNTAIEITEEEIGAVNNAYGYWEIDSTNGKVLFKIYTDKTADFVKAYGDIDAKYDWLSVGNKASGV